MSGLPKPLVFLRDDATGPPATTPLVDGELDCIADDQPT
jgi:hypothetical protein